MADKTFNEIWREIRSRSSGRLVSDTMDEFMEQVSRELDRRYPANKEAKDGH